jgi:hypothetical protein
MSNRLSANHHPAAVGLASVPQFREPGFGGRADESEKLSRLGRLFDDGERAAGEGPATARRIRECGHNDDGQSVAAAAQFLKNLETVHPWHLEVEQQTIARDRTDLLQERATVGKLARVKTFDLDEQTQGVPGGVVVINDEYHSLDHYTKNTITQDK